jgi:hypothetical protein
MASGTFLPPGLSRSIVKIESGGTDNYVMTAVDGETIQGEIKLQFDGSDLTLADDVGIIFGDAGEKIEGDGTNLVVESSGTLDLNSGGILTLDSGAAINIEPAGGSVILLDGTISIDAGVVTGVTDLTSARIDATTDFTIGDTVITDGVITDSSGLQIAANVDLNDNTLSNVGAPGNDWTANALNLSSANSGAANQILVFNSHSGADSNASVVISSAGTSGGDAILSLSGPGTGWVLGLDNSATSTDEDNWCIGWSGTLGGNDSIRITTATPGVVTFNTSQGSDFDYVCEVCGRHEAQTFTCCGKVEWHDDVKDFRGMSLREESAMDYMERVGVINRTTNNAGEPEVFTAFQMVYFVGSMAYQNRQRMDAQNDAMDERLKRIEQALGV